MSNEQSFQKVRGEAVQKCPECGSTDLVRKDKEIYCRKCGAVIE